jgi:perosamine synthetase
VPVITSKHVLVGEAESDGVARCLKNGEISGGGPVVREYETALCAAFGPAHAVACSSGTAAIYIALRVLGVGRGDEVIVPPTAPAMTALPVLALGASVRFADVRPGGFSLDPEHVAAKLTPRTKAVIEVPMWGYAADLSELRGRCESVGAGLVEDASQAHGSQAAGKPAGTQATIGAFSTHARKLIATGEGGFLLTDHEEHFRHAQRVRSLGQSDSGDEAFGEHFGLNFKLPAILASIGLAQVARLEQRIAARNAVAQTWLKALADLPGLEVLDRPQVHNCYGLAVRVPARLRTRYDDALASAGVLTDTRAYRYRPLNEAPLFRADQDCPVAAALVDELIVLPCHEGVADSVIEQSRSALGR